MQKLGQHFLKNDAVIKKIIDALDLRAGDAVIEIGPGHGELTIPLANACSAVGASLTAIEKDTKLADGLREKFAKKISEAGTKMGAGTGTNTKPESGANINIECGDALKILPKIITKINQNVAAPSQA